MNIPLQNPAPKRCAVYCRVSTDERLDQTFNSIDAQREAGHAFIASQRAEGWIPVSDNYDDGGFSGGNMDRPALKRLMLDIEHGLIDIVVVYKIDRLSRSLADFARMVEIFDRHGVSFSAVTQQINSATSMGRLMLNVLLSFAQFEREVTGERIRDKIAASKKKGMWMGGVPPLGYDVKDRLLCINEAEAKIVQRIFADMLAVGSPTLIAQALTDEGITTKVWTTQDGQQRLGARLDKKHIYKTLHNPIYIGEISHKGKSYQGQHEPIIDKILWDRVQAVIASDSNKRANETKERCRNDALLRGLLYTPSGEKMQPTFTRRRGKQYKYYVSTSELRFGASAKTHDRLPADLVEEAVVAQVKSVLISPETVQAVWNQFQADQPEIDDQTAMISMGRLSGIWEQLFPAERHRIIHLMVERVDLVAGGVRIVWHKLGWKALIREFKPHSVGAKSLALEAAA